MSASHEVSPLTLALLLDDLAVPVIFNGTTLTTARRTEWLRDELSKPTSRRDYLLGLARPYIVRLEEEKAELLAACVLSLQVIDMLERGAGHDLTLSEKESNQRRSWTASIKRAIARA